MSSDTYLALALVCSAVTIFSFLIGFWLDKRHSIVRFFLVWMGLFFMMPAGNLALMIAQDQLMPQGIVITLNAVYYLICVVNAGYLLYVFVYYTRVVLTFLLEAAKPKWKRTEELKV